MLSDSKTIGTEKANETDFGSHKLTVGVPKSGSLEPLGRSYPNKLYKSGSESGRKFKRVSKGPSRGFIPRRPSKSQRKALKKLGVTG